MRNSKSIIHKTALIDEKVQIGQKCAIGAYSTIKGKVLLNDSVTIGEFSVLSGPLTINANVSIGSHCMLGHPERDKSKRTSKQAHTYIQNNCTIRSHSIIYQDVNLDENVELGHSVLVREDVRVGKNTLIGTGTVLDGHISIGNNVRLQTGVYISSYSTIEDNVFIGPYGTLLNDKYMLQQNFPLKGPIIRSGVSIGGNAILLPSIEIEKGSVVGSGAVVVANVPPRTIVAGVPAKKLREVPSSWNLTLQ